MKQKKTPIHQIIEMISPGEDGGTQATDTLKRVPNQPDPDTLAADMIENLQSVLESFSELQGQLKKSSEGTRI